MALKLYYLHGMGGSAADWQPLNELLPGECLSFPVEAKDPGACAALLASRLPAGPLALCGYSMGGRIALLLCRELARLGRLPAKLVLVSAGFGSADPKESAARLELDRRWQQLAANDSDLFWRQWYAQDLFASFAALPPARKETWLVQRKTMDISHLIAQLGNLGPGNHGDLLPLLSELREQGLSVLYLAGELDKKYVNLSQMLRPMGVSVAVIPGAGHILPLEAPAPLAQLIREFLDAE